MSTQSLAGVGHNNGPPLEPSDFTPATWNQRLIAQCARAIALMMRMAEAERITKTKQMPRYLLARKLLFYCLQEERPFGDSAGEVRYGHLAQAEIEDALAINRKTIGRDVDDVQRWCSRSTEFEAFCDSVRDGVDAIVCLFDYEERIVTLADQQRALDRIRRAVDMLEIGGPK